MGFTDHEKARIKHFGQYPDWSQLSNAIQLGFPAGAQPLYLVEQAFERLTAGGEESVRRDLCECESIEKQMSDARKRFKAKRLGELETNPEEITMLARELTRWSLTLLSDLGCFANPASVMAGYSYGGGRNAAVMG